MEISVGIKNPSSCVPSLGSDASTRWNDDFHGLEQGVPHRGTVVGNGYALIKPTVVWLKQVAMSSSIKH